MIRHAWDRYRGWAAQSRALQAAADRDRGRALLPAVISAAAAASVPAGEGFQSLTALLALLAAISRDERRLVTNGDGEAHLWNVPSWLSPIPSTACALLRETSAGRWAADLAALNERCGISIRDAICQAPGPPFDPARIDPR